MAIYVANNGQLQTIKGIYYGMSEDYVNATLFHNLVPKTATEIRFLYASNNPDLTDYQRIGYCDNNNFVEVWNNGTKYIIINPRKNYIYAPTDCSWFLYNYTALIVCNIENFNTQNVTNVRSMFQGCSNLASLDLSNFKTDNIMNMQAMFYDCRSCKTLDLSNFNTERVTNMWDVFHNCISLTNLDVSSFNTQNVTTMESVFNDCESLTSLNISNFDTNKVTSMKYMFYRCFKLESIYSKTFVLKSGLTSNNMFTDSTSLVGGNGTTYSASHVNAKYARVDGENGLPGYFTAPTN